MSSAAFLPTAPGIYVLSGQTPPLLEATRMDVCAFVGVAPRGPSRVPVLEEAFAFDRPFVEPDRPRRRSVAVEVESFDDYRRLFGGFEGPGLLPYAVAGFFEQGGRRAYIVRIVHDFANPVDDALGVAQGTLSEAVPPLGQADLAARDEGDWGNSLRASMGFTLSPVIFEEALLDRLVFPLDQAPPVGALLRLTLPSGSREMRFVARVEKDGDEVAGVGRSTAFLESPSAELAEEVDEVQGTLLIDDGDGRREEYAELGLTLAHPRWLATVLCNESELVYPHHSWAEERLTPQGDLIDRLPISPSLPEAVGQQFSGGVDRYRDIVHEDFFDAGWVLSDPDPGDGVHAMTRLRDLSSVVVPDLYHPFPLPEKASVLDESSHAGPTFVRCVTPPPPGEQEDPAPPLEGLMLDPSIEADLQQILDLQKRLVGLADRLRNFVVLLDVPPGLSRRQMLRWRAAFGTSYAAAYHPWLLGARLDDDREGLIRLNPSACAAGIIASKELRFGVPHGPANEIALGVVDLVDPVSPELHGLLHPLGINVYIAERDGISLSAARTLSRSRPYRQLSVRRLMLMLRRVLEQQTQWMVFEPNGPSLRADVRRMLVHYLRTLFQIGAFAGATEEESFFVRCDDELNPTRVVDAGRLIAEIGVAPAEPLEFILLRLTRDGDGTLSVE